VTEEEVKRSRQPIPPWKVFLVLAFVFSLLVLFAYGLTRDPKAIPSPLVKKEAPLFTLNLLEGGRLRLQDLRGKVVVVNFWSTWCYPACWNEAPRLEAGWRKYQDRGVVVVGIVYQDTEENAKAFVKRFGKTYPIGLDLKSRIAIEYGVYGVPETFFIDREGKITHKHVGELSDAILEQQLEKLL